jgi:hypothetical protein
MAEENDAATLQQVKLKRTEQEECEKGLQRCNQRIRTSTSKNTLVHDNLIDCPIRGVAGTWSLDRKG